MDHQIEIKKRSNEGVVCWRVNADKLTPNTEIIPDKGLTVFVTVDGETKMMLGRSYIVNALFHPGKGKKMVGGNKSFDKFEIYALDQASEFEAEWGIGGATAIPCRDFELDIDCTAVAFGKYRYKIESFANFKNSLNFASGEITEDDVREFLRTVTTEIIRGRLAAGLVGRPLEKFDLAGCQAATLSDINKRLSAHGLTVSAFSIENLSYDRAHALLRAQLNGAKAGVAIGKVVNEGRRDDIDVEAKRVNEVVVPTMNAQGNLNRSVNEPAKAYTPTRGVIICPRCHTENEGDAIHCKKCGEKLS